MVQHRFLGEVDRHEPLGIANASSGQVYVADGNAGGAWSTLASPIPSGIWRYQTAYNAADVFLTESAWTKLALTDEYRNAISGASISSGVITLPAGTYYAAWWYQCTTSEDQFQLGSRLRDTTNTADLSAAAMVVPTTNGITTGSQKVTVRTVGSAVFTLSGSADVELQYYTNTADGGLRFESFSLEANYEAIHAELNLYVQT